MGNTKIKVIVAFFAVIAMSLLAALSGMFFSHITEARAADGEGTTAAVTTVSTLADLESALTAEGDVSVCTVGSRCICHYY